MNPLRSVEDSKTYILRETPKTRFMDFGLLYENDEGEYVVLNDVRMADIRLALLVYVSTYCIPIELLRQNKPFRLLYLGHAKIKRSSPPVFLKVKYFLLSLYLHQTLKRNIVKEIWVKIFLPKSL